MDDFFFNLILFCIREVEFFHFFVELVPIVSFLSLLLEKFGIALFDVRFGGFDLLTGCVGDGDLADFVSHLGEV
jgi:hypothetical protein